MQFSRSKVVGLLNDLSIFEHHNFVEFRVDLDRIRLVLTGGDIVANVFIHVRYEEGGNYNVHFSSVPDREPFCSCPDEFKSNANQLLKLYDVVHEILTALKGVGFSHN